MAYLTGGTDTDYWRELAAGATSRRTASVPAELQRLADAERYERLYSAAAQMLDAQGSPTWRGDRWPVERRRRWRDLEQVLVEVGDADAPGGVADPARRLISTRDAAGQPARFGDAVRDWNRRLGSAGVGAERPAEIVMAGQQYVVVIELLTELRHRLAPGRPVGAVGADAAELGGVAQDLADALRAAMAADRPASRSAGRIPAPHLSDPLNGRVSPEQMERLVSAATEAAAAVPGPERLTMANDFSVRYEAAVAAADVLAMVHGRNVSGWRERHGSIRPDRHLVSGWRWDSGTGRPVGFAERAAEIRTVIRGTRAPWRPTVADPVPESTADHSWVVLPDECALIAADLLDELGERMRPGSWIGTINFAAFALRDFLPRRIRIAVTEK